MFSFHGDMNETTTRIRTALTAVALLAALPIALSACTSSAPGPDPTSAARGVGAEWGNCMRDAGFAVQDPTDEEVTGGLLPSAEGVDREASERQAEECRRRLGVRGIDDAQKQTWARQYDQVTSCVREHGYADFPEQQPGVIDTSGYARATEPQFEETFKDCLAEYAPDTKVQDPR